MQSKGKAMIKKVGSVLDSTPFSDAFRTHFDVTTPDWVKITYKPSKAPVPRPFHEGDFKFFARSIGELSDILTEDRSNKVMKHYFSLPKFRSAYLLYFYPLQTSKFYTVFENHFSGKPFLGNRIEVTDFGAGPGTASLAFLMFLEQNPAAIADVTDVVFTWIDRDFKIMKEGEKLTRMFLANSKHLSRLNVSFEFRSDFKDVSNKSSPKSENVSPANVGVKTRIYLLGHILNETTEQTETFSESRKKAKGFVPFDEIPESDAGTSIHDLRGEFSGSKHDARRESARKARVSTGMIQEVERALFRETSDEVYTLFIEPAAKSPSQTLSELRDEWIASATKTSSVDAPKEKITLPSMPLVGTIKNKITSASNINLIGPCLHMGLCPLARGRDWCHFSTPTDLKLKWFREFSKVIGEERKFLKFSFMFFSNKNATAFTKRKMPVGPAPVIAVSDTFQDRSYLTCEPIRPKREMAGIAKFYRGDLMQFVKSDRTFDVRGGGGPNIGGDRITRGTDGKNSYGPKPKSGKAPLIKKKRL